ncbi:MAG TPA: PP2C family protein-serine/threonine phosphatase [Gaiellales bacterium]
MRIGHGLRRGLTPPFEERRLVVVLTAVVLELAVAVPFLVISPARLRGVPGPLLIVICISGAFLTGPRLGALLAVLGVSLGVGILDEHPIGEPLVWIPAAVVAGLIGDRVRRGDQLRRALLDELRRSLVALPGMPAAATVQIASKYVPAEGAQVLAADFYGILDVADGAISVLIGDVAGHGPASAAAATRLRAAWRGLTLAGVKLPETLRAMNGILTAERVAFAQVQFATVCLALIEPDMSSVCIVSAGHPRPILLAGGRAAELAVPAGPPIGVDAASQWHEVRLDLPPRPWSLLVYTDGLVEGRTRPDGPRPFGDERLLGVVGGMEAPLGSADLDQILAVVKKANGGPMPDDVVMVAVSPG